MEYRVNKLESKYIAHNCTRYAVEDDWNNGCNPDTEVYQDIDITYSANTLGELVCKIKRFHNVIDDQQLYFKDGGFVVSCLECEDGAEPGEQEKKLWKQGKLQLWSVDYYYQISVQYPVEILSLETPFV